MPLLVDYAAWCASAPTCSRGRAHRLTKQCMHHVSGTAGMHHVSGTAQQLHLPASWPPTTWSAAATCGGGRMCGWIDATWNDATEMHARHLGVLPKQEWKPQAPSSPYLRSGEIIGPLTSSVSMTKPAVHRPICAMTCAAGAQGWRWSRCGPVATLGQHADCGPTTTFPNIPCASIPHQTHASTCERTAHRTLRSCFSSCPSSRPV